MSADQVQEWLDSDRGSPWKKAIGGPVPGFGDGGVVINFPNATPQTSTAYVSGALPSGLNSPANRQAALRPTTGKFEIPNLARSPANDKVYGDGGKIDRALHVASNMPKPKHLQYGGMSSFDMMRPPLLPIQSREAIYEDSRARPGGISEPLGHILSSVPGRTDRIDTKVPADSYVIPADVVSGLGEGNTLAGSRLIDAMFNSGPYGLRQERIDRGGRGVGIPRPPTDPSLERSLFQQEQPLFAKGGAAKQRRPDGVEAPRQVPVVLAGGEYVIPPEIVKNDPRLGNGDIKHGHAVLDAFVKHARKETIKEMQKLPGPKK